MKFKFVPDFPVLVFFLSLFTIFRSATIGDALVVGFLIGLLGFYEYLKYKEIPKIEVDPQRFQMQQQIEMMKLERDLNALQLDKARISNNIEGVKNEQKKFVF